MKYFDFCFVVYVSFLLYVSTTSINDGTLQKLGYMCFNNFAYTLMEL